MFISSFSLFLYFFALVVIEEESDQTNLVKPFGLEFLFQTMKYGRWSDQALTIFLLSLMTFFNVSKMEFYNKNYLDARRILGMK